MMIALKKYANLIGLTASYYLSRFTGRSTVWGMPFTLGIELTNNCNLRCRYCDSGSGVSVREKGYMAIELFEKIVKELSGYTVATMFYFQGESMMHPRFFEMLRKAEGMGVIVSTNGHYLNEDNCKELAASKLRKIIISLDGISAESYSKYRVGGNLDTVLDGIVRLSTELFKKGRGNKLELQVLVNRYNEGELKSLGDYARKLGVRIRFKSMQITSEVDAGNFLPGNPSYRRYNVDKGLLTIRSKLSDFCYRFWTNPVITWDGNVLPCCFDKDARYILGNMEKDSFIDIWNGQLYSAFRERILQNRAGIDICNNCSEGLYKDIRV